jgi:hypothetical protein
VRRQIAREQDEVGVVGDTIEGADDPLSLERIAVDVSGCGNADHASSLPRRSLIQTRKSGQSAGP